MKSITLRLLALAIFVTGLLLGVGIGLRSIPVNAAPEYQDPGQQVNVFANDTITTTAQTAVTPCSQGNGSIGRKTIVVENDDTGAGAITVTTELRTTRTGSNFTSGYLAVNGVATNTLTNTTATATTAAGAFCLVSAVSANTSTITVTLRRE